MITFKKIICPIDFSKSSRRDLEAACGLARQFDSELWLVHIVADLQPLDPPPEFASFDFTAFNFENYRKEMRAAARKELKGMIKKEKESGVRVKIMVELGNPAEEIVRLAQEKKADLILLSSHAKIGMFRRLFGSVAYAIVSHSPCPVLLLPGPVKSKSGVKKK